MGIGMQVVYLGFPGAAQLEAEAGAQLVRLARFGALLSNCHLAIEALGARTGHPLYDVRLDLITPAHELQPIAHCANANAEEAIRRAFDLAEKQLETTVVALFNSRADRGRS
ncbi:hypothetical protein LJ656_07085 [Paraburkholderia sp. MMS20-SJTR3]|uniref:Metal ABC transporter ATPase n=1 Tax=Paraburkholderia sejongensis TaxID=2886946 RepID=A0ABS8JR16_9BURK|nr:hypothetical protein [Paraburkholderia sp. MMS20-SJTR3]MCC8392348.1 hypothetical protein [Paraburkholderia sp. MMS20-SJTR3]